MKDENLSGPSVDSHGDHHMTERIARDLLTLEKPVLFIGSSPRWGWNDSDPVRRQLISRLQDLLPTMELVHVPDRKSTDGLEFSPGISVFAGIPMARLEGLMASIKNLGNRTGRILILNDHEIALEADHVINSRDLKNVVRLLELMEKLLGSGEVVPWGRTPEGLAFQEGRQKKLEHQRKNWTWDETREINIPEEFRHELAAGLDENAE